MQHHTIAAVIVVVLIGALQGIAQAQDPGAAIGEMAFAEIVITASRSARSNVVAQQATSGKQVVASGLGSSRATAHDNAIVKAYKMADFLCLGEVELDDSKVVYHKLGAKWIASVSATYSCPPAAQEPPSDWLSIGTEREDDIDKTATVEAESKTTIR